MNIMRKLMIAFALLGAVGAAGAVTMGPALPQNCYKPCVIIDNGSGF